MVKCLINSIKMSNDQIVAIYSIYWNSRLQKCWREISFLLNQPMLLKHLSNIEDIKQHTLKKVSYIAIFYILFLSKCILLQLEIYFGGTGKDNCKMT